MEFLIDNKQKTLVDASHPLYDGFEFSAEQKQTTWPSESPIAPFDKEVSKIKYEFKILLLNFLIKFDFLL